MIETPFRFEPELTSEEFKKLGQLAVRWSHIEHYIGNCLRVVMRLSMEEAVIVVFPLSTEKRLQILNALAELAPGNSEAIAALSELKFVMKGLQIIRNDVLHGIIADDGVGGHVFHNRSKQRQVTKKQVLACEELTNYAAHAVISLRYALGLKDAPGARHPLPERPAIPELLQTYFPTPTAPKKGQRKRQPRSSPA